MRYLIVLLLLVSAAGATDFPAGFGNNIRFASVGAPPNFVARGQLSEHIFVLTQFYFADELQMVDKPMPRMLVMHADQDFANFPGPVEIDGIEAPARKADIRLPNYLVWIKGDGESGTITSFVAAIGTIFQAEFGLDKEKLQAVEMKVLKRLQADILDVKDYEKKK